MTALELSRRLVVHRVRYRGLNEVYSSSQKQNIPVPINRTASPTKYGPAAPVILLPHLSSVLKHLKTLLAHIMAPFCLILQDDR